jgi:hypothetical protein
MHVGNSELQNHNDLPHFFAGAMIAVFDEVDLRECGLEEKAVSRRGWG